MSYPRFQPAGDSALLVTFADQIDLAANRRAHDLACCLREKPLRGVGEAVPGYVTLMVSFDPLEVDYAVVEGLLKKLLDKCEDSSLDPCRIEVPVVYGGEYGPDLEFVAAHNRLSADEVIRLHSGRDYPVYMMGFMPGFPYLGGLDSRITAPRLDTPRSRVPAGSVGIAGSQTGIYPFDSPGGWRLIGRTSLRLFDPSREPPFLLHPGDLVRFVQVADGEG